MDLAFSIKNFPEIGENQAEEQSAQTDIEIQTSNHENGPEPKKKGKLPKVLLIALVSVIILVTGSIYGWNGYKHVSSHEETDDAYITSHLHQVSTRINGTVDSVLVDDNEHVKKGQVLVILDPRDFQVKVDQALANLSQAQQHARAAQTSINYQDTTAMGKDIDARGSIDNALAAISKSQANVREAKAAIQTAQSTLASKEAELERAALDYKRWEKLEAQGAVSTSDRDAKKRDYLVALENRNAARNVITEANERFEQAQETVSLSKADLTRAQGQVQLAKASAVQTRVTMQQYDTDLAAIESAQASLNEARLNLSYTKIVAPTNGRIGKKTVEEGHRVEPGQQLLTIVEDNPWVVANYKETQLKKMYPGQAVEIKIDSLPDHKFKGVVQSFAPASGASFAVLPSDNATGNFTKIVQRIPVKILFDSDSIQGFEDRLAPGLSVITSVSVAENEIAAQIAGL